MANESFDITYAAHTASCSFLLDAEGICRRIVMVPKGKRRDSSRTAARCVGAQYVASLDTSAAGGLVEMPRVGAAMLFARIDERGRVSLVRTGVVTAFEALPAQDHPFVDSASVETSAPEIVTPRVPTRPEAPPPPPVDDYYDASDRTQRLPALRDDAHELKTAEYHAAEDLEPHVRATIPSHVAPAPPAPTLRNARRDPLDDDDDFDLPRSVPSRGMLPRLSEPFVGSAARARAIAPAPPQSEPVRREHAAPAPSDVVLSRRRRS